jgi:AraC-like DNA-binding protein
MSLRHLERRVKVNFGTTPRLWLKRERLRTALALLLTAQTVKEVAYSLGYPQFSQFCREFKLTFGLTATEFRRLPTEKQEKVCEFAEPCAKVSGRIA